MSETTLIYNANTNTYDVVLVNPTSESAIKTYARRTYAELLTMENVTPDTVVLVLDASGDTTCPTQSAWYAYVRVIGAGNSITYQWKRLDVTAPRHVSLPLHVRVATPNGTGNGTCWAAPSNLKDLLTDYTGETFYEIWLAADLYDVSEVPPIPSNVSIIGGFVGTETTLADRALNASGYPTAITMLQSSNDGAALTIGSPEEPATGVIIDGIRITDRTITEDVLGSALTIYGNTDILIRRCTFTDHTSVKGVVGGSGFTIDRCFFHENTGGSGAAIHGVDTVTVMNTRCYNNYSTDNGGAIYVAADGYMENCDIYNNTATHKGGGVYGQFNAIVNSNISNNKTESAVLADAGGAYLTGDGVMFNTTLVGNTADSELSDIVYGDMTLDYCVSTTQLPGAHSLQVNTVPSLGVIHPSSFSGASCVGGFWIDDLVGEVALADFSPNGYATTIGRGTTAFEGINAPQSDMRGTLRGTPPDIGAYQYTNRFASPVRSVNGMLPNSSGEVTLTYKPVCRSTGTTIPLDPKYSVYLVTISSEGTISFNMDNINTKLLSTFDIRMTVTLDGLNLGIAEGIQVTGDFNLNEAGTYFFSGMIDDGVASLFYLSKI